MLVGLAFDFVYLDDIIIASHSMEQHQRDVEEFFHRLQAAGLVINFEKCTFAVPEVLPLSVRQQFHPPLQAAGLVINFEKCTFAIECPPAVSPPSLDG